MIRDTSSWQFRSCLWPSPWSRLHHPDSVDLVCDQVNGPDHIILLLGLVCDQLQNPGNIILTLKVLSATKSMIQATSSWQSISCLWPCPWPRSHHPGCLDLVCDKGHIQGHISLTLEVSFVATATSSWLSRSYLWLRPWSRPHHPGSLGLVCDQVHDSDYIILTD